MEEGVGRGGDEGKERSQREMEVGSRGGGGEGGGRSVGGGRGE